jgi:hypothetical protein
MSAPPQTDERLLDLTWPGWLPLPPADGLVAVIPDQQARTAWADKVLGRDAGGFVMWTGHRRRDRSRLAMQESTVDKRSERQARLRLHRSPPTGS